MKLGNSGLEKFAWLRMLKNSARSDIRTCSPSVVTLNTEKLSSLKLGPSREFRPSLPKCRVPGTQLLSSVLPSFPCGFPKVQGAANAARLRYCEGFRGEYCGVEI